MGKNTESKKNIIRIDSKRTHGWQVRLQYNNETHGSFFADKKHGGKDKALEKAIIQRQRLWDWVGRQTSCKPTEYDKRFYYPKGQSHRKTQGIPGVYRTFSKMRSGQKYPYYKTTVHIEKGKAVSRGRSVNEHGELEAFLQVAEWRADKMAQIYPERFDRAAYAQKIADYADKIKAGEIP